MNNKVASSLSSGMPGAINKYCLFYLSLIKLQASVTFDLLYDAPPTDAALNTTSGLPSAYGDSPGRWNDDSRLLAGPDNELDRRYSDPDSLGSRDESKRTRSPGNA